MPSLACKCPCLEVQLWPSLGTLQHLLLEHTQHSQRQFAVLFMPHELLMSVLKNFAPGVQEL